jgi:predicted aconitase with swiveling domain
MILKGRGISKGLGRGELLVSPAPISFLSGVNPDTGVVVEKGHPLEGKTIAGRVLAFPYGKGSTVGSYIIYAIIAGIPMIDRLPVDLTDLQEGAEVTVNGESGELICGDAE